MQKEECDYLQELGFAVEQIEQLKSVLFCLENATNPENPSTMYDEDIRNVISMISNNVIDLSNKLNPIYENLQNYYFIRKEQPQSGNEK